MAKNIRLGIIRARHDTTVPVISDAACIAMLMVGEHSVLRYWLDTTRNYLDFIDSPAFCQASPSSYLPGQQTNPRARKNFPAASRELVPMLSTCRNCSSLIASGSPHPAATRISP
jgi:hypothetical protein